MKEKRQPGRTPRGLKSQGRVNGKGEDEEFLSGEVLGSNVRIMLLVGQGL
jgi:hypothetical protein